MELSIISFTRNGMFLSEKLVGVLTEIRTEIKVTLFTRCSEELQKTKNYDGLTEEKYHIVHVEERIGEWTRKQMEEKKALLFIGACGIAVRAIAPCITDKLHDSPVLVMDERGEYVIPILSGHIGGANGLAQLIAEKIGAVSVITTATDINKKFAVDLFAKKNGLHIVNKEGIAKVSSKVLAGKEITISIESGHFDETRRIPKGIQIVSYPPDQFVDVVIAVDDRTAERESTISASLWLRPKEYVIGMGCRRGKEADKIEDFLLRSIKEIGISTGQLFALTSIEKKKDEQGFLAWSRKEKIPFITYTVEQLQEVKGEFHQSAFVKDKVGVDNVCERAALRACEMHGMLIYEKHSEDGMTVAIAKREWSVVFDEE